MTTKRFTEHCNKPVFLLEKDSPTSVQFIKNADYAFELSVGALKLECYIVSAKENMGLIKFRPLVEQLSTEQKSLMGLIDGYLKISKKRSYLSLFDISLREWESYFRDENHAPAFSSDIMQEVSLTEQTQNELNFQMIKAYLMSRLKMLDPLMTEIPTGSGVFVDRIKWLKLYLEKCLGPLLALGTDQLRLYNCSDGIISIDYGEKIRQKTGFVELLNEVIEDHLASFAPTSLFVNGDVTFKIVAVTRS